ncbi:MSP domain-containing protein [Aphelenchoides avenae]|nr:MSP domain-containing protein [Aphelenchus avenae]KAH7729048.1 MSP domain-containing protein [Aphelenchus avenae]
MPAAESTAFDLKLEPAEKVKFAGKKLGEEPVSTTLKVTNPTKERVAIKVKCTSNEMFRIRPPVSAIKPDETVSIQLIFQSGKTVPDSGKHYFVVYYIKATDDKKAAREAWKEHKGDPAGMKRLHVDFSKDGAADEKKDDKKEEKKEDKPADDKKEEKDDKKADDKKDEEKKEDDKKEDKKDDKKEDKEEEKKEDKKDEKADDKKEEGGEGEDEKKE